MDYILFCGCIDSADCCALELKYLRRFTRFESFIKSLDGFAHITAGAGITKIGLGGRLDAFFSRFDYWHETPLYRDAPIL